MKETTEGLEFVMIFVKRIFLFLTV